MSDHKEPVGNKNQLPAIAGEERFRLIACPRFLSSSAERTDVMQLPGDSIWGVLRSIGWERVPQYTWVTIDGRPIPMAQWEYTLPAAGQTLCIKAIPAGTSQGKDALRIASMIAVVTAAIGTAGLAAGAVGVGSTLFGLSAGAWGGIAGAGVSIVGSTNSLALLPSRRAF